MLREIAGRVSWLLIGAVLVAALFLFGWIRPWFSGPDIGATLYRRAAAPAVAPSVKEVVKWETKVVTREVKVYVPAPKAVEKLEKEFDRDLDDEAILADVTLPRLPEGGEALVTTNTAGDTTVTVRPNKAPFIRFGGVREVAIGGGLDDGGERLIVARYRQDLLRVGPAVAVLELEGELADGEFSGRALALGVVRF